MIKRRNPTIPIIHPYRKDNREEEAIEGVIKVYKDGRVERPQIVPDVTSVLPPESGVSSFDVVVDKGMHIWARCYVPKSIGKKVPVLVYFHGGGFCVGAPSWSCYHEFLAKLAGKTECAVVSVSYRLAPENVLPAAYEDGVKAIMWLVRLQGAKMEHHWSKFDFSSIFLCGDSAGANIVHHVSFLSCPLPLKGTILIQPFFGGESRTRSEVCEAQQPDSLLTLAASDAYWRLALPVGADRDHPWCNPVVDHLKESRVPPSLVLVSELDILRDRSLELCEALSKVGKKVKVFVSKGVGHAFHILSQEQLAQTRTDELIDQIKAFIHS